MMEEVCTSEMSVDNHFTRQYIPEDNSEHRTHCGSTLAVALSSMRIVVVPDDGAGKTQELALPHTEDGPAF
jgi:hypothetical protein